MMLPFDLPPMMGCSVSPKWDGRNFVFGGQSTPVLEYSENFAGWSDDLTALHEQAVSGGGHPIDIASRGDALRQVKKRLPRDKAVIMEAGCSSGYLIRDLVKSFPEAVIIASDIVKAPLYRLAKDFPGVPVMRFDLLRCPLPDQSVDVLVMLNVLEHIEDDLGALRKVFNVLKPGGALVIEVPAFQGLYDAYDAQVRHFRRYSAAELYGKLTTAGFNVRRKSYLGLILFPAFVMVKLLGKCLPVGRNKSIVRERIGNTRGNPLVKWALEFESKFLSDVQLPFGIRVLATAVKPGAIPKDGLNG
ncbi:MAG: class I SAM-dependent methyltransferase [Candidatus Omnitrophica bacterium]|nr:class I SAM-dependent methyltransferase [Candidatus Omnitrophota bacterium]